ncbi:TolC family protein [Membranihabitans maritimus]|uniref:TolC family protein n=1 Tax=Membranihabitans maritimus TaxID=2904244 RepID=UPI001EFFA0A2|nr:TolC family protein [Membranihabitans maritimus]
MRKRWIAHIIPILCCIQGYSQTDQVILSYNEYINAIKRFHPVARQADLKVQLGDAEMLKAKGNFDPNINSSWREKNFSESLYYRQYSTKLRIPTVLGLDLVAGYENTEGKYLNPELNTDDNGLWHIGIELDILQGLIVNERKTTLTQAKVFQQLTKNEKQVILNELLFNATYAYLQWQLFHHFDQVLNENLQLANTYFENTKQSFFGGDKTAMDTLEAHILSQNAQIELQKNDMELVQSRMNIENFLWYDNQPMQLQPNINPEDYFSLNFLSVNKRNDISIENNPSLLASINKLSMLEIEQKLKREKLKPKLKLKYNPLLYTTSNSIVPNYSIDNYSWGFVFAMPLFLRSERADIQQGKIKMFDQKLEIENKKNELENKIENTLAQQNLLRKQHDILEVNTQNYKRLLDGENEKFLYGESSVFLLNKRQEKYITSRLKLIGNQIKMNIEQLKYLYYTNTLTEE